MAERAKESTNQELIQVLASIVGEEHVQDGASALPASVDGVIPRVAVYPADPDEIGAVLAYADQRGLAVLPVGGGTQLGLGHPPERADIALFLTRLDRIVAHEPADMTVTVQAGMSIAALQAHLAQYGQCLPYDPPLPGRATIGGIVATREAGPLRQMFRGVSDRLLGIQVVTAQGKLAKAGGRVVKNVTGYEMSRLYTGSLGTLGVIVEVTFKVQPRFEAAESLIVTVPDLTAAGRAVRALLDCDAEPVMLELLGPTRGGGGAQLFAGYAGTPEEVAWQLDEAERIIAREFPGGRGGGLQCERTPWPVAHESVLRAHRGDAERVIIVAANAPAETAQTTGEARAAKATGAADQVVAPGAGQPLATCRVHVRATQIPDFLAHALSLAGDLTGDGSLTYAAHAGTGIVRLHVAETDEERLATLISACREKSVQAGGFLIIERASPTLKQRLSVFGPPREDFFLHKAVKQRMDPNRILNPGRFIGNL